MFNDKIKTVQPPLILAADKVDPLILGASEELRSQDEEYGVVIDALNETMSALAARSKAEVAPLIEELNSAQAAFNDVSFPAMAAKTAAEDAARSAHFNSVCEAKRRLDADLAAARAQYDAQIADAKRLLDEKRAIHDTKVKELNRLFQEEKARQLAAVRKKEYEIKRKLRRQGIRLDKSSANTASRIRRSA